MVQRQHSKPHENKNNFCLDVTTKKYCSRKMLKDNKPSIYFFDSPVMSSSISLLSEMVSVLYRNNAIWVLCGGAGNREGLSPDDLLTQLNAINVEWDETLVTQILRLGMKMGALRQQRSGPNCVTGLVLTNQYFLNWNMLFENNANAVFRTVVPALPSPHLYPQHPFVTY